MRPAALYRSPWVGPVAAAALLALLFSLRLLTDIDLGFHLRGGQWMFEHHAFHGKDVFTYTANDRDYVALHWLFQLVLYLVYQAASYRGLSVLTAVLVLAGLGLLAWRIARAGAPHAVTAALLVLAVLSFELRMQLRPELFSWLLLGATLLVLDAHVERRRELLWLLPLVQLLWINLHGLFVLGWVATLAYLAGVGFHERRFDRPLAAWGFGSFAITLLNPWGLKGVLLPVTLFTRLERSNVFKQAISELRSPWSIAATERSPFGPPVAVYVFYFLAAITVAAVLLTLKRRRLHELVVVAAFLAIASAAVRNVPFFYIVALPVVAAALRDLCAPPRSLGARLVRAADRPAVAYTFTAVLLLAAWRVTTDAYYVSGARSFRFGLGLDPRSHTEGAGEFLRAHSLTGRVLNDFNSGSWLIWTAPQPVYIDGRMEVIGERLFQEYLTSFAPGGLQRLADKVGAQLVVYDPQAHTAWTQQLKANRDWRLIHWTSSAAIWARAGYAPEIPALDLAAAVRRMDVALPTPEDVRRLIDPPLKPHWRCWLEGFVRRQEHPEWLSSMGIFAYQLDQFDAAQALYCEAIRRSRGCEYQFYFNLGSLYFRHQRWDLARRCYQQALAGDPHNRIARERLDQLAGLKDIPGTH